MGKKGSKICKWCPAMSTEQKKRFVCSLSKKKELRVPPERIIVEGKNIRVQIPSIREEGFRAKITKKHKNGTCDVQYAGPERVEEFEKLKEEGDDEKMEKWIHENTDDKLTKCPTKDRRRYCVWKCPACGEYSVKQFRQFNLSCRSCKEVAP